MERCGCCARQFDCKEMVKNETNSDFYYRFCKALLEPTHLYSRSQVLTKPCPVPKERGLYAWYFKEIPCITPTDECVVKDDLTLLYVGRSPRNDKSTGNLRKRVSCHFEEDASGSTLRLTLGVLLTEKSGFPLRIVGSDESMTFTPPGESSLNDWMEQNAFVCWATHPKPWEVEADIINSVSPLLNIQKNRRNPFRAKLKEMREEAKRKARGMPIFNKSN